MNKCCSTLYFPHGELCVPRTVDAIVQLDLADAIVRRGVIRPKFGVATVKLLCNPSGALALARYCQQQLMLSSLYYDLHTPAYTMMKEGVSIFGGSHEFLPRSYCTRLHHMKLMRDLGDRLCVRQ